MLLTIIIHMNRPSQNNCFEKLDREEILYNIWKKERELKELKEFSELSFYAAIKPELIEVIAEIEVKVFWKSEKSQILSNLYKNLKEEAKKQIPILEWEIEELNRLIQLH